MKSQHPNNVIHYGMLFAIYSTALLTLLGLTVWHSAKGHSEHEDTHAPTTGHIECTVLGGVTEVVIKNGLFEPQALRVEHCDQVKITNLDDRIHTPAFGEHNHHSEYGSYVERELKPGESNTFTASEHGLFTLHDHQNEDSKFSLTVD